MTLVLETLGGDETLDTGSLFIFFLVLIFRLDFATDDEFADLQYNFSLAITSIIHIWDAGAIVAANHSHHHP